jgi:hypothetical protein
VSRKVAGLENVLRLDIVGFQDVTQESRDVRLGGRNLATRGGRASWSAGLRANKAASVVTGGAMAIRVARRATTFASATVLNEGKSQLLVVVDSVDNTVVRSTK